MESNTAVVLAVALCLSALSLSITARQTAREHAVIRSESNAAFPTEFDLNLAKAVYKTDNNNLVLSTISVKLALAMLYLGAVGPTAQEIENVLYIKPESKDAVLLKFNELFKSLQTSRDEYEFNVGTKLFLDKSTIPNSEFIKSLKHYFNSSIETLNFKDKSASVKAINDWAKEVTNGKLQKLVTTDDARESTVMLLINAIYFKGLWEKPFPQAATKTGTFDGKVQVPFMTVIDKFRYGDVAELDCKVIRLPYLGKKFAMYVYLPTKKDGLDRLSESITPKSLKSIPAVMKEQTVQLVFPKFSFESTVILGPLLQQMGLSKTFSEDADLDNIGRSPFGKMFVSNILQKAGLEVNEKGSIAYAATEVDLDTRIPETPDSYFTADRPFIFAITNEETNTIAFIGKVTNPAYAGEPVVTVSRTYVRRTREVPFDDQTLDEEQQVMPSIGDYHDERYNYLDVRLLQAINNTDYSNIVISPESIKSALAMLWEGSRGETAQELGYLMKLTDDENANNKLLRKHQSALTTPNTNVTLLFGSRIFLALDEKLLPDYQHKLKTDYSADINPVDFNRPDTVNVINKWVTESTEGVLTSLVDQGYFNNLTRIFLANFIYFKADWLEQFDSSLTTVECFYTEQDNKCQKSYLMNINTKLNYNFFEKLKIDIVEIPFKYTRFSMIILLPKEKNGLNELLNHLPEHTMRELLADMSHTEVHLMLPRFSIEYSISLKQTLQTLQVSKLFVSADLSGMLDSKEQVYVSDILHKARIEIDEKGAKSAASTGIEVQNRMFNQEIEVRVDHPFVFFIHDKSTEGSLFEGVIHSPDSLEHIRPSVAKPSKDPSSSGVSLLSFSGASMNLLFLLITLKFVIFG